MFLFKLACFLEILLYLMIIGVAGFVIVAVVYDIWDRRKRGSADPILYDDDTRAGDFLAEVALGSWNM